MAFLSSDPGLRHCVSITHNLDTALQSAKTMSDAVKPLPDGYHTVTPYLIVRDASSAIDFYKRAFGATELGRFPMGDKIAHAEIQISDSRIMLADEHPEMDFLAPSETTSPPVSLHVYVEDVDRVVETAVAAGAKIERPVIDQFYGDRIGTVRDPFGHRWSIATRKENVSMEEMQKRAAALFS